MHKYILETGLTHRTPNTLGYRKWRSFHISDDMRKLSNTLLRNYKTLR